MHMLDLKTIKLAIKFSELTVFSFHPVKMITTGEGGGYHKFKKFTIKYNLRSHGIIRHN